MTKKRVKVLLEIENVSDYKLVNLLDLIKKELEKNKDYNVIEISHYSWNPY